MHSRQKDIKFSRGKGMGDAAAARSLPDVGSLSYLLSLMFELGFCNGEKPVSWCEIEAWQRLNFIPLELWEVKLLKELSNLYVQSTREYGDTNLPSPVQEKIKAGADLDQRIKNALKAVGNRKADD